MLNRQDVHHPDTPRVKESQSLQQALYIDTLPPVSGCVDAPCLFDWIALEEDGEACGRGAEADENSDEQGPSSEGSTRGGEAVIEGEDGELGEAVTEDREGSDGES